LRGLLAVLALIFSAESFSAGKIEACLVCHGAGGVSTTPLTPSLGGQPSFYVIAQLFLFREGRRDNPVMIEQAKELSDGDLRSLSETISKLSPPSPSGNPDAERYLRGKALVEKRHCASCHGRDFSGHNNVPRIAHQREDYTLKALRDYRSGKRIGYGNAVMPETVSGLSDDDLAALAHYLAFLKY